jgi:hypothetical protein
MKKDTILSRSEDYLSNEIDGEIVMMNIETGMYVSMNATGKSVWDILENPASISDILTALTKEYEIDAETCQKDVTPFIEQMIEKKILQVA